MDTIIFIVIDLIFCATGGALLWILTLGRFRCFHAGRGSAAYFALSIVGFLFWLVVLYISVKVFGG